MKGYRIKLFLREQMKLFAFRPRRIFTANGSSVILTH